MNIKNIKTFILISALFLATTGSNVIANTTSSSNKPNIVLVFIDDMGWGDFSSFGNTKASTPNIDSMANEGLRFHQFYVNSPICSPSRVAISTGQYPQRHKITSYLAKRSVNEERGVDNWLDTSAPMLARYLKNNGYATGHFGKWHMGGQRDVSDAPEITEYGFDESITNFEGMGPKILPLVRYPNPDDINDTIEEHIWNETNLGGPITYMLRNEITGGFARHAIRFIDSAKAKGKPFYINVWPDDVHTPLYPSMDSWSDDLNTRYQAVLEEMDTQFAELFQRIKYDPELRKNTIIFICSDNGPEINCGSPGPFKGLKATLYEAGVRSPLIVWGPGFVNNQIVGEINDTSILAAVDFLPSILSLTSTPLPQSVDFDGSDMSTTFIGASDNSRPAPIFFRRPPDRKTYRTYSALPDLAIRSGDWKLLCDHGGVNVQLYNLNDDPGETNNVALQNAALTDSLVRQLLEWNAEMPKDAGVPEEVKGDSVLLADSLVFYLPLDNGFSDASNNSISFIQDLGTNPSFSSGKFGNAIAIDNMRFITENDSIFNPYKTHTLAAWVKSTSLPSQTSSNQVIIHQIDDPSNHVGRVHMEILKKKNGVNNVVSCFTGGDTGGDHRTNNTQSISVNNWVHFASVWNQEMQLKSLFINGILIDQVSITSTEQCFGNYTIGANKNSASPYFGMLDDVVLVKQALSSALINDLMNKGVEPNITEIPELRNEKHAIKVIPNPASDYIFISSNEIPKCVSLYGIDGKLVLTADNMQRINTSDLKEGVYLLQASFTEGITRVSKVVINRNNL